MCSVILYVCLTGTLSVPQVMQTVFFGLCVVTDLIQMALPRKRSDSSFLVTAQDFFFTGLAFPVGTVSVRDSQSDIKHEVL